VKGIGESGTIGAPPVVSPLKAVAIAVRNVSGDAMRELAAQFLTLAEKHTATGARLVG